MREWKRAKRDLHRSARALLAFQRGEDSDEAYLGALIVADFHSLVRQALTGKK